MHRDTHKQIYIYIHNTLHINRDTYKHTHIHRDTHTIHTCTHAHRDIYIHTLQRHTYTQRETHTHTPYTYVHMHTETHTNIYTHYTKRHTYTHRGHIQTPHTLCILTIGTTATCIIVSFSMWVMNPCQIPEVQMVGASLQVL